MHWNFKMLIFFPLEKYCEKRQRNLNCKLFLFESKGKNTVCFVSGHRVGIIKYLYKLWKFQKDGTYDRDDINTFVITFFWPCPRHVEVPGLGNEPMSQQQPKPLQWQCQILSPLNHKRIPQMGIDHLGIFSNKNWEPGEKIGKLFKENKNSKHICLGPGNIRQIPSHFSRASEYITIVKAQHNHLG